MKKLTYTSPQTETITMVTEGLIAGSVTLNNGGEHDMFGGSSASVSSTREFSLQGSSEEDTRDLFSN